MKHRGRLNTEALKKRTRSKANGNITPKTHVTKNL